MKPRVLVTQKILAVAVAAAGCAAPSPRLEAPVTAVEIAPQRAPAAAASAAAQMETVPASFVAPPPPAPPKRAAFVAAEAPDPEALQEQLFNLTEREAVLHFAHFRPLCDDKGFPVVGNISRKAAGYRTSQFCSLVRSTSKP